jgi:hypothetical protein
VAISAFGRKHVPAPCRGLDIDGTHSIGPLRACSAAFTASTPQLQFLVQAPTTSRGLTIIRNQVFVGCLSKRSSSLPSFAATAVWYATCSVNNCPLHRRAPKQNEPKQGPEPPSPARSKKCHWQDQNVVLFAASFYMLKQDLLRLSLSAKDMTRLSTTGPCELSRSADIPRRRALQRPVQARADRGDLEKSEYAKKDR